MESPHLTEGKINLAGCIKDTSFASFSKKNARKDKREYLEIIYLMNKQLNYESLFHFWPFLVNEFYLFSFI